MPDIKAQQQLICPWRLKSCLGGAGNGCCSTGSCPGSDSHHGRIASSPRLGTPHGRQPGTGSVTRSGVPSAIRTRRAAHATAAAGGRAAGKLLGNCTTAADAAAAAATAAAAASATCGGWSATWAAQYGHPCCRAAAASTADGRLTWSFCCTAATAAPAAADADADAAASSDAAASACDQWSHWTGYFRCPECCRVASPPHAASLGRNEQPWHVFIWDADARRNAITCCSTGKSPITQFSSLGVNLAIWTGPDILELTRVCKASYKLKRTIVIKGKAVCAAAIATGAATVENKSCAAPPDSAEEPAAGRAPAQ